jgi:hypothetical protein
MDDPRYTFSEPILLTTPGGRLAWLRRPLKWVGWIVVGILVLQGLDPKRAPDKNVLQDTRLIFFIVVYAILVHCLRRKIQVSDTSFIELHAYRAVSNKVFRIDSNAPIMILDTAAKSGLRKIELLCSQARFDMLVTQTEAERLEAWSANIPDVTYRKQVAEPELAR